MKLLRVDGVVRLARDIEISYTQGGTAIAKSSVVSSEKYKTATGEEKEEVCFTECVWFARAGEIANQYLRKGSRIHIRGKLKLDQWTAQDGSKRSKHSIQVSEFEMLDPKQDSGDQASQGGYNHSGGYNAPSNDSPSSSPKPAPAPTSNIPEIDINEDEIPF